MKSWITDEDMEATLPPPDCRSCHHVIQNEACRLLDKAIPFQWLAVPGCPHHRYAPGLLNFAELMGISLESNALDYLNTLNGMHFSNAEGGANDYSSQEIYAAKDKRAIGDDGVEQLRDAFGAGIVSISAVNDGVSRAAI